jgi:glucokinase
MVALITVDIGGTSMRAAAYPSNSIKYLSHKKISTQNPKISVFENLVGLIRSVWPDNVEVAALSVACAAPLDPKTGFLFDAPNIPGWKNFPLGDKLREVFQIPVILGNDANLAAVGEWIYGAGVGHSDLIYLTISTGIGGGIISNNNLLEGFKGLAGELGHITVQPDGPICHCGKKGHLEALSSGLAIVDFVKKKLAAGKGSILNLENNISAYDVAIAATNGDELAKSAFEQAGFYLGQAIASFIHIFNPSIIILGGGIVNSGSHIFDPVIKKIKTDVMDPIYLQNLEIVPARLGDDAGLVGALVVARQKFKIS